MLSQIVTRWLLAFRIFGQRQGEGEVPEGNRGQKLTPILDL